MCVCMPITLCTIFISGVHCHIVIETLMRLFFKIKRKKCNDHASSLSKVVPSFDLFSQLPPCATERLEQIYLNLINKV